MDDWKQQYSGTFISEVTVAAIKGERPMSELSSEYGVHPTIINMWKQWALEALPGVMSGAVRPPRPDQEELIARLYQQIGQLKVELDLLKSNL